MLVDANEMCGFVRKKQNKQSIWLAMDVATQQIIAFHVGERDKEDAEKLWLKIPKIYREKACFSRISGVFTLHVFPEDKHVALGKHTGLRNYIEHFNLTVCQRV
ncbi:MAG: hypothetical protein QX193_04880 [Methylococcales bacterium]